MIGRKEEELQASQIPEGYVPSAKILIVDDEKEVCEILSECLEEDLTGAQYTVRYALSGDEALKIANEFEPDLAIIDIKMPHMWGDELIEKFKRGESFCPKDFIIFTGAEVPEQRKKAKTAGHEYLSKPDQIQELAKVVKKVCLRHHLLKKTST